MLRVIPDSSRARKHIGTTHMKLLLLTMVAGILALYTLETILLSPMYTSG
jgi:hypothetical protein